MKKPLEMKCHQENTFGEENLSLPIYLEIFFFCRKEKMGILLLPLFSSPALSSSRPFGSPSLSSCSFRPSPDPYQVWVRHGFLSLPRRSEDEQPERKQGGAADVVVLPQNVQFCNLQVFFLHYPSQVFNVINDCLYQNSNKWRIPLPACDRTPGGGKREEGNKLFRFNVVSLSLSEVVFSSAVAAVNRENSFLASFQKMPFPLLSPLLSPLFSPFSLARPQSYPFQRRKEREKMGGSKKLRNRAG